MQFGPTVAVKLGGVVWHLEQIGVRTVCGLPTDHNPSMQRMCAAELEADPGRVCKSCLRMKDATTVRLRPWTAAERFPTFTRAESRKIVALIQAIVETERESLLETAAGARRIDEDPASLVLREVWCVFIGRALGTEYSDDLLPSNLLASLEQSQ